MPRRIDTTRIGLPALFGFAAVVRLVLAPMASGQDFRVWDLASAATLGGVDVYAHHPPYPGGPYAYLPLFMWLEVPFQWLAQHGPVPFVVLGKLPMVAADLALARLVHLTVLRRGGSAGRSAVAACGVLLNPLVLYNGAYYGRFDAVALALLFAACYAVGTEPARWRQAWAFAFAVAAKTFPIVVLPALVRRGPRTRVRVLVALAVTVLVLLLPYRNSLGAVLHDTVLYDAHKPAQALSWHQVLPTAPVAGAAVVLACGGWLVIAGLGRPGRDLLRFAALAILLFLLADPVVLEQYLTWPLPFVVVGALTASTPVERLSSWALYGTCTAVGLLVNPYLHPFGSAPVGAAVLVAAAMAGHAVVLTVVPDPPTGSSAGPCGRRAGALLRTPGSPGKGRSR